MNEGGPLIGIIVADNIYVSNCLLGRIPTTFKLTGEDVGGELQLGEIVPVIGSISI